MSENYSCDNSGNRTPPHPDISNPVLGTGQNVSAAAQNTNYSNVVVEDDGGGRYISVEPQNIEIERAK